MKITRSAHRESAFVAHPRAFRQRALVRNLCWLVTGAGSEGRFAVIFTNAADVNGSGISARQAEPPKIGARRGHYSGLHYCTLKGPSRCIRRRRQRHLGL